MIANKREIAEIFSVSYQSVDKWITTQVPFVEQPNSKNGNQWKFDIYEVAKWKIQRDNPAITKSLDNKKPGEIYEEARAREMLARARRAELELAKEQGKLVDAKEVEKHMADLFSRLKNMLLVIPSNASTILKDSKPAAIKEYLREEIEVVLNELSVG